MESLRSNADNLTVNETINAATHSTPTDGISTERRDGSIQELVHGDFASVEEFAEFLFNQEDVNHCSHGEFCLLFPPIWSWTSPHLLENTNALTSANTSNGERTIDVFNPYMQTIIPVKFFSLY